MTTLSQPKKALGQLTLKPSHIMIVLWVLSMITLPILKWTFGEVAIVWGVNITTLMQSGAVLAIMAEHWGTAKALRIGMIVVALTWAVEATGTATGFPFGHYHYTDILQPQLTNVPLIISIAWLMMIPPAWAVTTLILKQPSRLMFAIVAGLAMTAWDFYLDPQMVAWDLWRWDAVAGSSYFGIPWVNFLGWWGTAALITWLLNPRDIPVMPMFAVYVIVWLMQAVGESVFWGLVGPAVVGFFTMGAFVGLAAYRTWGQK